jgi:hypothetical protein
MFVMTDTVFHFCIIMIILIELTYLSNVREIAVKKSIHEIIQFNLTVFGDEAHRMSILHVYIVTTCYVTN